MSELPKRGQLVQSGDELPGRWVDDGEHGGLRVWKGESDWHTQHGPATVQWSLGRASYVWNAAFPDGSRANVSSIVPAGELFRRPVGDSYQFGAIDVRENDVIFKPIAAPDLPKLVVDDEMRMLFDILSIDERFMRDIRDIALARALYSVLENASFMHSDVRYDFGQRSAGHFVAALRNNGELYFDFAWSGNAAVADLEVIRAHFDRLDIFVFQPVA